MQKEFERSPQNLQRFREEGNVGRSDEFTQSVQMLAITALLVFGAGAFWTRLQHIFAEVFTARWLTGNLEERELFRLLTHSGTEAASLLLPLMVVVCVFSLLINFWQVGPLFTLKTLSPEHNLKRVGSSLKSRFAAQTWRDMALLAVKFAIVLVVGRWLLAASLPDILRIGGGELSFSVESAGTLLSGLLVKLTLLIVLFGIADLLLKRKDYSEQSKLTWEDKRTEIEQEEGKPEIRAGLREAARELLDEGGAVDRADACFLNPTHLLVAVARTRRVRGGQTQIAYRVVAKGSGARAQRFLQESRRRGIPEYRNVSLTRRLYRLKLGHEIPPELFQTVHLILGYLYRHVLYPQPPHTS